MRIRKRAVPLPLSLLSPVPFSDRLLQLAAGDSPPPADDLLIGRDRATASVSPVHIELKGYGNEKNKEKREDNNHSGKRNDAGAVSDNGGVLPPPPPPTPSNLTEVEGRWCEGDKAIPFKKRKVRLEFEMSKLGATKMKSKTNKKCSLDHHDSIISDDSDVDNEEDEKSKKKKKTKRRKRKEGSRILQEGSRCSRVNGRGWRCMQPTLVGYSLCDHHLGKGRLRSISAKISCTDHEEVGGKKKMKKRKVGMVKARSLSSLLCQPETKVVQPAA